MAQVFVSYSRTDRPFVMRLQQALEATHREPWIDLSDIPPSAKWMDEIRGGIEGADTFLCVLSPAYLASNTCGQELIYALECKKRMIALLHRDVDPKDVPSDVAAVNWIMFRDSDVFDTAFRQLLFALDTDLNYWHQASDLLVRSKRWATNRNDSSLALRGTELAAAEHWLAEGANKRPNPTQLQTEFITASRRVANRRRITVLSIALTAVATFAVVTSGLAIAIYQRNLTISNQDAILRAQVGNLVARNDLPNNQIDQAMLLSVEGYRQHPSLVTRDTLFSALEYSPYLEAELQAGIAPSPANARGAAVAFGGDHGNTLMYADSNGQVSLWDVSTRHRQRVISQTGRLVSAALSPDGQVLATGVIGAGLTLWNTNTGQPTRLSDQALLHPATSASGGIPLAPLYTPNIAFSPDGNSLAIWDCADQACMRGQVTLWDVRPGADVPIRHFLLNDPPVFLTLAFSPDGQLLATGDCFNACQLTLWRVNSGKILYTYPLPPNLAGGNIETLAFSPSGRTLAVGGCLDASACNVGQVVLFDMASGQVTGTPFIENAGPVGALAFSPDGQTLLTGASAGILRLWDVASRTPLAPPLLGHTDFITSAAFSPDGLHFASTDNGSNRLLLWRLTPYTTFSLPLGAGRTTSDPGIDGSAQVVFSPDGTWVATGNCAGEILLWNLNTARQARPLSPPPGSTPPHDCVRSLAFSADGQWLGEGFESGTVLVWSLSGAGAPAPAISYRRSGSQDIIGVALSPDGQYVASTTLGDSRTMLVDTQNGQILHQFTNPHIIPLGAAFSPDGSLLAVSNEDSTITLWNVQANTEDRTLSGAQSPGVALAFSPDGRTLAMLGQRGDLTLWDVANHFSVVSQISFPQPSAPLSASLMFSRDGKTLAAAEGRSVLLWDVAHQQALVSALLEPSVVINAALSPSGQLLAVALQNGPILVRYATPDQWQVEACEIANRNLTQSEWSQFFSPEPYHSTCPNQLAP